MPASDQDESKRPLDVDRFFQSFVIEPRIPGTLEGTFAPGKEEGEIRFVNCEVHIADTSPEGDYLYLVMRSSNDAGRTWSDPWEMHDAAGERIRGDHNTVFRMKSGKLGLVYSEHKVFPSGHPGRDGGAGIMFRDSSDEGRTWSDPILVHPFHALCCAGHAIVLESGRIVAPAFRWISHNVTGESESASAPSLSYSFAVVSDDEGKTWRASLSELFVSHYRAAYDLEEPTMVELKDGRLLGDFRCQLGRRYRSFSEDGGISWSRPKPVDIAGSYTPSIIRRMPTGELLMIWNQISRTEIMSGFHRHRLSVAISRDEGETWENFKDLESLDDETVIPPPPSDRIEVIERWDDHGYHQPGNTKRYHRTPGALRICYPDVIFVGDEAIICYDYGAGILGDGCHGTKLRAIPLDYLRE